MARAVVVLAACALAGLVVAPTALAHAILERSEPRDGAVLAEPPRVIRLWFSEDVVARFSSAELLDGRGRRVGTLRLEPVSSEAGLLTVAVPQLRRGVYSFRWTVLSEEDSHVRRGGLVFRVGPGAPPALSSIDETSPLAVLDVALRWVDLALLLALTGAIAVAGLVLTQVERRSRGDGPTDATRQAWHRVLGWGIVCAALSVALGIALLGFQATALARNLPGGTPYSDVGEQLLTDSRWGTLWLARESILVALLGALILGRRAQTPGRGRSISLAAALAVALAVAHTLGGHAAAAPEPAFMVPVATLHLLAAATWVGGLLALLVVLWPLLRGGRRGSAALARASLKAFGVVAGLSVALLVATGLFYAGRQVASIDALVSTVYGQALGAKTLLILAMGAIGAANAAALHPHLARPLRRALGRPDGWTPVPRSRLRVLVLAEAGVGLAVVGAAAVLAATAPARGPEFSPIPGATQRLLTVTADDLLVTISVKPSLPGPNVFEVRAASTRRPPPGEVERVSLRFTSPTGDRDEAVSMREIEPGLYRLGGDFLSSAGQWRLEAAIDRIGLERSVASFGWPVAPEGPRGPVLISDRPLESVLTRAAALVLVAFAVGVSWLALVRRRAARLLAGQSRRPRRVDAASP